MTPNILGDKKKTSFDDNLADYVNAIFEKEAELEELKKRKKTIDQKSRAHTWNVPRVVYDVAYFNKLDVEVKAKERLTFNKSQKRLENAGYERHLSFQEQMGLIILYLEGKLSGELEETAEDMLKPKSEWCNQLYNGADRHFNIFEKITSYSPGIDPYSPNFSKRNILRRFDTSGLESGNYNNLKDIHEQNDLLIEYLFTKPFEQLPDGIQKGGGIWFSTALWPVARGFLHEYYLYGIENKMASRGVREKYNKEKNTDRFDEILK